MIRKLLQASVVTAAVFGLSAAPSAGAATIPTGDGQLSCATSGTIKVVRSTINPNVARLVVAGTVSGCSYNGRALPFVGGMTRSIAVGTPSSICAALANGNLTAGRSGVTVKVLGIVMTSAALKVSITVTPVPGGGDALDATGSVTLSSGIAIAANVSVQTDIPLTDLCAGTSVVSYQGTASLSWSRPAV